MRACVCIFVQYVRAVKLWPFGLALDHRLKSFIDSRDSGAAILTHVYLQLGMALPMFAYPISSFRSGMGWLYPSYQVLLFYRVSYSAVHLLPVYMYMYLSFFITHNFASMLELQSICVEAQFWF